jgi:hypothetical protein
VLSVAGDDESNFFGIAYKVGTEIIIAFRGTDDRDLLHEDIWTVCYFSLVLSAPKPSLQRPSTMTKLLQTLGAPSA